MKHFGSNFHADDRGIAVMPYRQPDLQCLRFDPAAPADPQPLGEPVLSARDVLAVVYSALEEIEADETAANAIKLEAMKAVGEGKVGLAMYRAIIGASRLCCD